MNASHLIEKLKTLINEYGDLPVNVVRFEDDPQGIYSWGLEDYVYVDTSSEDKDEWVFELVRK